MLIIDGHEDLAYNGVELDRDLTAPVADIRAREGTPPPHNEGTATVSLPALRDGGVRIVFATIFTYPAGSTLSCPQHGYHTPDEAYRRGRAHLRYYHKLSELGEVSLLRHQVDLNNVLAQRVSTPGLCLLMEGADPLRTPHDLDYFVAHAVRIVGLAWKATRYAGGTGAPGPLTPLGRELLLEMDRLGVALDVSHLAEEAFWQAERIFKGKLIASHANCRALVPGERQLTDDMIRAIADRDGVIGLVGYNAFIRADWHTGDGKMAVSLRDLLPQVQHLRELVGMRHIALGSDLDGGIGREAVPREINTVADLHRFTEVLAEAGYAPQEIAAIMGNNWLRVLRAILR